MSFAALPPSIGKYNLGQSLGKGSFSLVKVCQNTETGQKFAIKIIPKSNINTKADLERFEREVNVIIKMSHPGIIKIHDFLVDPNFFYLVMDLCTGGTLLSQTEGNGKNNEERARPIFKQLLETVKYIHEQGIAHRDLKLENVLLDDFGHIKIIDFGFSRFADPGQMLTTPCGTPAYAAPEVIGGFEYDGMMADMWSLGVILFGLVTGELPWKGTNQIHIFNQIKNASFDVPPGLNHICVDLIKKFLVPDPTQRLTAAEALTHPWLEGVLVSWGESSSTPLKPTISMNTFTKILTSQDQIQTSSPRSQLNQLANRRSVARLSGNQIVKGPLSFGGKAPAPLAHGPLVGAHPPLGSIRPPLARVINTAASTE